MLDNLTPEAAIIELNRIRTNKGERPPEIDMAIKAINICYIKQRPNREGFYGSYCCPRCHSTVGIVSYEHCGNCGQALDWGEGGSIARSN